MTLGVLRPGSTETVPVMLARQPTARLPLGQGQQSQGQKPSTATSILSGTSDVLAFDEAFPKQTLDKLRQLRVTLEQVLAPVVSSWSYTRHPRALASHGFFCTEE